MDVQSLGYRTDLALRQLEGAEISDHGGYLSVRTPSNPSFWWGNFLLVPRESLAEGAAAWTSRFAAAFPGAGHLALGVDGTARSVAVPAGYVEAGLKLDYGVVLTAASAGEPPHPNRTAELRPLRSDGDWAAAAALRAACHDTGNPGAAEREFTEHRVASARRLAESGHGACFGAFLEGRLVAQLGVFSAGPGLARYQNVETHPAARGRGLAGSLVCLAGRYAADALGASTLVIVADPDYHAIRVYRSAGFSDREIQAALERPPDAPAGS